MSNRAFAAVILLFLCVAAPANAETNDRLLLEQARADIEARNLAHDGTRFGYTIQNTSHGDEVSVFSIQFDPSLDHGQQWAVVSPSAAEDSALYEQAVQRVTWGNNLGPEVMADQALIVRKIFAEGIDHFNFLHEENERAIYQFKIEDLAFFSEGNEQVAKMSKFLTGELSINTTTSRLQSIRIYARKPFKPVVVAKVKTVDIQIEFAPAWDDGPLVQVGTQQHIAGSALFRKFTEKSGQVFSNFKRK